MGVVKMFDVRKRWHCIMKRHFLAGRRLFASVHKYSQTINGSRFQIDYLYGLLGGQVSSTSPFLVQWGPPQAAMKNQYCCQNHQYCPQNYWHACFYTFYRALPELLTCVFYSVSTSVIIFLPNNAPRISDMRILQRFSCVSAASVIFLFSQNSRQKGRQKGCWDKLREAEFQVGALPCRRFLEIEERVFAYFGNWNCLTFSSLYFGQPVVRTSFISLYSQVWGVRELYL